jgi:threonine dehydrogenase-like Zn-dependent dehydrogenase
VPDSVPDEIAVFTEPVAAAFQILEQVRVRSQDRVAVLGDGRLGNLCAQVLALHSNRVVVVGKHTEKLSLLAAMGIETALLPESPPERSCDIVVDCTGSDTGLTAALRLVRPRGTIVMKTTIAGAQTLPWAPFVIDEITLVGSRCGPFDRALQALEQETVKVRPLISERVRLAEGTLALERAQAKGVLKVLIDV